METTANEVLLRFDTALPVKCFVDSNPAASCTWIVEDQSVATVYKNFGCSNTTFVRKNSVLTCVAANVEFIDFTSQLSTKVNVLEENSNYFSVYTY